MRYFKVEDQGFRDDWGGDPTYWLEVLGKKGQKHNDSTVRTVHLPPRVPFMGWDISEYRDRWDLIEQKLKT